MVDIQKITQNEMRAKSMTYIEAAHMAQALHMGYDADIVTSLYSEPTLVIDTSFGATVGVVGYAPLYEADSRSHVELLQPNIAKVVEDAGLQASDIRRVVVGTGPAPFTGLRAGIVAARAFAYATGAEILGMNVLEVQSTWNRIERANMMQFAGHEKDNEVAHYTLAVNDARRKQLYYALYDDGGHELLPMDIASAEDIAQRIQKLQDASLSPYDTAAAQMCIDVIGHGAQKYASAWESLSIGEVREESVLHDAGAAGLGIYAAAAVLRKVRGHDVSTDPLYLRRPDVTIPAPSKHILGQTSLFLPVGGKQDSSVQQKSTEV